MSRAETENFPSKVAKLRLTPGTASELPPLFSQEGKAAEAIRKFAAS